MIVKTDFKKVRDIIFLKDVLITTFSCFGGPEMHIGLMMKKFVNEKKYITEKEFLEFNSLCNVLPGPSTTQLITSIGYHKGGPFLAFYTLLIWILPAAILMSILAITTSTFSISAFRYVAPMALAFILVAAIKMSKLVRKRPLFITLVFVSCIFSVWLQSPYVFPIALIIGSFLSVNFGKHDIPEYKAPKFKVTWRNLVILLAIFAITGILGLITKHNFQSISEPVRLFENIYRMGTLSYGGGSVLNSMILTEFVEFKPKQYLTIDEFNIGLGMIQAVPGPTFTIATYSSGLAMKKMGYEIYGQLLGCGIGTIAVFLPGTIMIFFVFPIWNHIKKVSWIYKSLEGIMSVSVGFIWASVVLISIPVYNKFFNNELLSNNSITFVEYFLVFCFSLLYLQYTKKPTIYIVIVTILAGTLF